MSATTTKSVIVTGAGGGMGSAAVRLLAERGCNVLAVDWKPEGLERLAAELEGSSAELVTVTADVASADDVEAYVEQAVGRFGGLDSIFNIAGIGTVEFKPLAEVSNETYDEVMRINARSAWLGMKYSLPHLVARGGGTIVNTGSHLAWHAAPTFSAYTASKHAVIGMTKAVALEYGKDNVRANIVCPSAMDTAMGQEAAEGINPDDVSSGWQVMIDQSANGRVARPEETAAVGVWLLLDAPEHVSGVVFPVDGAQAAK
jgi:NAD(P)-dependent dehydrogenase (short-subunit alcohol dehydrogenase family)